MQINRESMQLFEYGYMTILKCFLFDQIASSYDGESKLKYGGDYKIRFNTENRGSVIAHPKLFDHYQFCEKYIDLPGDFFRLAKEFELIRGITNAVKEILNHRDSNTEPIRELFKHYLFENEDSFENFYQLVTFIRNFHSHNIKDGKIKLDDYQGQMNYLKKCGKTQINFSFNYNTLPKKRNHLLEINVNFNKELDGMLYNNIIDRDKTISFVYLCYDCVDYLNSILKQSVSH